MKEVLVFLASLPAIIGTIKEIMKLIKDTFGDDPQKFITDANAALSKLNQAQTKEDREKASRELADLIKRLG